MRSNMKTHIGINGACGRMGQRLIALAAEDHQLAVSAALDAGNHPKIGTDAGELAGIGPIGVKLSAELTLTTRVEVMIDFSLPDGTMSILKTCIARRIPLVVATTGHSPQQRGEIEAAAHETAILLAPNMSLAANILFKLTEMAAQFLDVPGSHAELTHR